MAVMDNFPRYAIYKGRKLRVLSYEGNDRFVLLDTADTRRLLPRRSFAFIQEPVRGATPVTAPAATSVEQPTLF